MALRGASLAHGTMSPGDINAQWYYEKTPITAADWDGYVPHHYGLGGIVSVCDTINLLNTVPTNKTAPGYWILMNEEDMPTSFIPATYRSPTDATWADSLYSTMKNITDAYTGAASCNGVTKNLPAPKLVLTVGTQYHAPPGTGKYGNGNSANWCSGGSNQPNDPDPWRYTADRQATWHCQHLGESWIAVFWNTILSRHPDAALYPSGFTGNFYPPNVDVNNYSDSENLNPQHVLDYAKDLRDWALTSGVSNPEIWIKELGTWVWSCPTPNNGGIGRTLDAQRDNTQCGGTTYAVRNFIGAVQDALGNQAIVNRWAWYADRYGDPYTGHPECHPGDKGGELTALNQVCTGTPTPSPFGNNFSVVAPYR